MFQPAVDPSPADWVVASLRGMGKSVLSLVPAGFPEYVRVLHPAYRRHRGQRSAVTWAQVADCGGLRTTPGAFASEIDFKSTYIGAGRACAEQLTSAPELEAYAVLAGVVIDWLSDPLNPRPRHGPS